MAGTTREITDIFAQNFIPRKSHIHNVVASAGVITMLDGVRNKLINDGGTYEELSDPTEPLYNKTTGLINAGTVAYAKQMIVAGGVASASSAGTFMRAELVIPSTSEIIVRTIDIDMTRVGVDLHKFLIFPVYSGPEAIAHGYELYLTAVGGNVDIDNRSILIEL